MSNVTFDQAELDPEVARRRIADRIRVAPDATLSDEILRYFNQEPCGDPHQTLEEGRADDCMKCGVKLRRHQRVGVSWLYAVRKGILADSVGTGKTIHAAALLAVMKARGELGPHQAVIVVRNPIAMEQWAAQLRRLVKGARIMEASSAMSKDRRMQMYVQPWDVLVIGFHLFLRDKDRLETLQSRNGNSLRTMIYDDIDPLRNPSAKTAQALKRLAGPAERVVLMTGTPLQKRLHEMHSVLEVVGGRSIFGSPQAFARAYVREDKVYEPDSEGRLKSRTVVAGYRNLDDFKAKSAPFVLRRTAEDIDDVDLPVISPSTVYLDLTKPQADRYAELRRGVLRIVTDEGENVKRAAALAQLTYGEQICSGLAVLGDEYRPGENCKIDYAVDLLTGDLDDEKVIIFAKYKNTLRTLQALLDGHGKGHVTIWGEEGSSVEKAERIRQFWQDPGVKVLLGTQSIEQSLNLQISRHLINLDVILNPARMEQLAGRIRRDGSRHSTVYVTNVLTAETQEDRYMAALEREQGLIDHVWDEDSQLFEKLSPLALLSMITDR